MNRPGISITAPCCFYQRHPGGGGSTRGNFSCSPGLCKNNNLIKIRVKYVSIDFPKDDFCLQPVLGPKFLAALCIILQAVQKLSEVTSRRKDIS